ncbi:MAG: mannose-1-phosphate guanylyltransferase/mannose-6-phosphate isomerase [Magnetococcus sp. WYHC-3]
MIVPVILSGGSGTRLWPMSRQGLPKQFLPLVDPDWSMFQQTARRLSGIQDASAPLLVCNEQHRFLAARQLQELGVAPAAILLEPVARNTAPAVACAALQALTMDPEALILVLPADHMIRSEQAFRDAVARLTPVVAGGALATFGIVPDRAETGYGYIQRGAARGEAVFEVARFVEKPNATTAQAYVDSGEYLWNSGMFLFRADGFLEELGHFDPDMLDCCRAAVVDARRDLDFVRLAEEPFGRCRADSVDYAVMERTRRAVMIPLDAGWSDVGAWDALYNAFPADARGNVLMGDVLLEDVDHCYIRAEKDRMIAAIGVRDLIIVETDDAVLVSDARRAQDVKKVVDQLKRQGREQAMWHRTVHRPWGNFETIAVSPRFQVKRITVHPGGVLSRQMHHHRAEHWVVVHGTARVTKLEESFLLFEDQSTYIPMGVPHRLENPGRIPLVIIEVQSGSYLGEDDIVRFDDMYGRAKSS